MKCKHCAGEIGTNAKFCKYCGAAVEADPIDAGKLENKCPSCGTINSLDAKFCPSCGAKLKDEKGVESAPQTPLPATYVGVNGGYAAKTKEEKKAETEKKIDKVSHIVSLCFAGALAFFSLLGVLSLGVNAGSCSANSSTFISIYELLADAFRAVAAAAENLSGLEDAVVASDVLGNLILAITIITALAVTLELTVRLIIKTTQISKTNGEGIGRIVIRMYFVFITSGYIIASIALRTSSTSTIINYNLDYSSSSNMSFATMLFFGYLISRAVERRHEFKAAKGSSGKRIAGLVCLFLALSSITNIMGDLGGEMFRLEIGSTYYRGSFLGMLQHFKADIPMDTVNRSTYAAWCSAGMVVNTLLLVSLALAGMNIADSIAKKKSSVWGIAFAGASAALSVALLIILLLLRFFLREAVSSVTSISTMGVSILVFCLLALALTVISAAVGGYKLDIVDKEI